MTIIVDFIENAWGLWAESLTADYNAHRWLFDSVFVISMFGLAQFLYFRFRRWRE